MAVWSFRNLLQRRRAARPIETRPSAREPEELERDQELLERVAAGIALNKTPGR